VDGREIRPPGRSAPLMSPDVDLTAAVSSFTSLRRAPRRPDQPTMVACMPAFSNWRLDGAAGWPAERSKGGGTGGARSGGHERSRPPGSLGPRAACTRASQATNVRNGSVRLSRRRREQLLDQLARPAGVRSQLYPISLPLKPAPPLQLNVGLMVLTVSSPASVGRLLSLHTCRTSAVGPIQTECRRSASGAERRRAPKAALGQTSVKAAGLPRSQADIGDRARNGV
jgi:hypothetical protein